MIDYIALFLGHALLAIAFLRLVLRPKGDADPLLEELTQAREQAIKDSLKARRAAQPGRDS